MVYFASQQYLVSWHVSLKCQHLFSLYYFIQNGIRGSCDPYCDTFGTLGLFDEVVETKQKRCTKCIDGMFGKDSVTDLHLESSATFRSTGLAKLNLCGNNLIKHNTQKQTNENAKTSYSWTLRWKQVCALIYTFSD